MSGAVYQGEIRLTLFDVNGVLSDGRLHMTGGEFMRSFYAPLQAYWSAHDVIQ